MDPDLVKLGRYAGQYGFVMTEDPAKTLSVYQLQAKEFTGYWAGGETWIRRWRTQPRGMADLIK